MPLDKNSPVGDGGGGVYTPWDLSVKPGTAVEGGPGFFDAIGPAFQGENTVGSLIASEKWNVPSHEFNRVDPDFDITPEMMEGYEDHEDRLLDTYNTTAFEAVKSDIDRERKNKELIYSAGWGGIFADAAASFLDLPSLIPGGAFVRAGKFGYSASRTALSVGAASGVGAAVQEGGLQITQQTRTADETAFAIGGSVILGGLLGAGGAKLLTKAEFGKFSRALEEDLADETPNVSEVSQQIIRKLQSAGAASKEEIDKIDWEKELGIAGGRVPEAIAKATAAVKLNPGLELLTSKSMRARQTFLRLAENHVATVGESEGRSLGTAVETNLKRYDGNLAMFIDARRVNFRKARKAGFKGKLKDFDLAVSKATRRSDVDPDGNEFVTATAESWRRDVADPLKDEAVGVRLLPEGIKVTTAPSYLYRLYDRAKILASEAADWKGPRFRSILKNHIRRQVEAAVARQEEIAIAKDINRAVDTEEQLQRANDRLLSLEDRLSQRGKVREGRLAAIRRKEGERFDVLRGRVPETVIATAKAARDDDIMVRSVAEASKPAKAASKRPMLRILKEKGGVKIGSPLDQELRAMGVDPRTAPGLFRKEGGLSAVDNFVAREEELLARFRTDQNGYADPDEILAAIRSEMAGAPLRADDELAAEAARDVLEGNVAQWLDEIGMPPNATAKEVRAYLDRALRNEGKLTDLDQAIGRMNGELEEFDRATDKLVNEKLVAEGDAGRFADELNELEAKINDVRELANASPTVKLVVDYADARKALGKGRYEQTRIGNRIEAIERALGNNEIAFPDGDVVGSGDFGPIIDANAYKGNWRLLVERLASMRDGEAHGALSHKEVGAIDVVWGNYDAATQNGHGLAKIIDKHPEVIDKLPDIIAGTRVTSKSENRIRLGNDQYSAVVRLEFDGKQKTWLLTAFEKKGEAKADARQGLRGSDAVTNGKQQSFRSSATQNVASRTGKFQSLEDLRSELRVLRADKNKIDERVINARAKVDKLKKMQPKDRADELDFSDDMDLDAYADTIVDDTFNRITGKTVQDGPDWLTPITQGPLKGRTLNIPDELIEDFLVNDMEMIARKYVRQMGAEVELTRNFGRADMKDQLQEIRNEYKDLRAAAKGQKEIDRLTTQEKNDIANLEAFRDMLRGTYRAGEESTAWSAMTRLALSWNYIRLLGGVALSSLPDLANVATRQGLRSFMNDGLPALTSSSKAVKIAKRDAREWGGIAEIVLQTRLAELAELNDPSAAGSAAERLMRNVSSTFSQLTMLDRWNDTLKVIVSVQTGNKVARLVNKSLKDLPDAWGAGGKQASFAGLDRGEKQYLGKLAIDEGMATRIADQIQKHGVKDQDIWGLNLGAWTDAEARRVMASALRKEADGAVVTPGIADKPLWARSNAGKLVMQFKSFGLAAHQRVFLSRLQGDQKHLAEFLVFGTAIGMMVSYLKYIERGDFEGADRLAENPGLWIADGFDRTGIAPVLMDVSNTIEKVGMPFGVKSAAQALAGDEDRGADVSRFASRNALGALLGPTAGTLQDLVTIFSQAANGEVNSQGARAATRQIPFGTLPGARTLIQTQVKPAVIDALE